jgi:hypothetical protein
MLLSLVTLIVLTIFATRKPRHSLTVEPLSQEAYEEVVHVDALGHAHPVEEAHELADADLPVPVEEDAVLPPTEEG